MYEKLKSLIANDTFFTAVLLLLVGVVSFGLGRQSVVGEGTTPLVSGSPAGVMFTDSPEIPDTAAVETTNAPLQVVASRSGARYHRLDCPGAAQIKDENKLFFETIELARAAGYTPATNCPGLQ